MSGWDTNEFTAAESRLVLSSVAPKIVAADTGSTFTGTNIAATLERVGLSFDAPSKIKLVKAIYPRIDGLSGTEIQVEIGASMDFNGAVSWGSPMTYTIGTTYKLDTFVCGRFLAIRFSSSSAQPWRLRSYEMEVVPQGDY